MGHEIVIVDRDPACPARHEFGGRDGFSFVTAEWDEFLDADLGALPDSTTDQIVPTPLSSHLMYHWLRRRALAGSRGVEEPLSAAAPASPLPGEPQRLRVEALRIEPVPDTPAAGSAPDGSAYLSFATWTCPVTCYEPAVCPHTRGPKAWEMDAAVFAYARERRRAMAPFDLVEVFRCRHLAWGIAAYPARTAVLAARRLDRLLQAVRRGGGHRRLLVATVSSCHGIASGLTIEASDPGGCV